MMHGAILRFGEKWFVTFIDDHTRLCWLYSLNKKTEVENVFKEFNKMVERQLKLVFFIMIMVQSILVST